MTEIKRPLQSEEKPISSLYAAQPNEFLPPIGQWTTVGGLVLLVGFAGAILLSAVLPYRMVVQAAQAKVRPAGELRLVQAAGEGKVDRIEVRSNQTVQAGQTIAYIDDTQIQIKKRQLQDSIAQMEQQLRQNQAQLQAISQQIVAATEQSNRTVAGAEADLNLNQRIYQDRQITAVAELQEAEAALALTQEELNRYRGLAQIGAIAELQIREKETAMKIANARLERVKTALNPSNAAVKKARERIGQEEAQGTAAIARLMQEQAQLGQQRKEVETKLSYDRQELQQIETQIQSTIIRAPISGIIQGLTLRNPDQIVRVGDTIAQIAPKHDELVVKALVFPQDIGKVAIGQSVEMRVSACPYPDYGILRGIVQSISPDVGYLEKQSSSGSVDAESSSQQRLYEVTIQPIQLMLTNGKRECVIQSGMEGQVSIISQQETVLQFILRKSRLISNI
ncbi:HlyD family efflux transporter periplasmic adaptor subunit [Cyanobacteria bacterium FACHB-DQ100]|nr:HlyD family efflux transporter periplasmic adaptor subunit [Cyanobacteria bacterium FACHB-DQ100]